MQDLNRPKIRVIALGKNGQPSGQNGEERHSRLQRHVVILMGLLWMLAFAPLCMAQEGGVGGYLGTPDGAPRLLGASMVEYNNMLVNPFSQFFLSGALTAVSQYIFGGISRTIVKCR